jgi:hypothetical protein
VIALCRRSQKNTHRRLTIGARRIQKGWHFETLLCKRGGRFKSRLVLIHRGFCVPGSAPRSSRVVSEPNDARLDIWSPDNLPQRRGDAEKACKLAVDLGFRLAASTNRSGTLPSAQNPHVFSSATRGLRGDGSYEECPPVQRQGSIYGWGPRRHQSTAGQASSGTQHPRLDATPGALYLKLCSDFKACFWSLAGGQKVRLTCSYGSRAGGVR